MTSQFEDLESPIESVRRRPGMYIGDPLGRGGLVNMVGELFANVVDLFLAGKATTVAIRIGEDGAIEVEDDGPGLLHCGRSEDVTNLAERYLESLHSSPTVDGHVPHVHFSKMGVGIIVVNALSSVFEVTSGSGKEVHRFCYERGQRVDHLTMDSRVLSKGTLFRFMPDETIFGNEAMLDLPLLRSILFSAAHLYPGLKISFQNETFCSVNGLRDYCEIFAGIEWGGEDPQTAYFIGESDFCRVNFACTGRTDQERDPVVRSWVNGIATVEGGSHVEGMMRALERSSLKPNVAMISVIMNDVRFAGPTRSKLVTDQAQEHVERLLNEHFSESGLAG